MTMNSLVHEPLTMTCCPCCDTPRASSSAVAQRRAGTTPAKSTKHKNAKTAGAAAPIPEDGGSCQVLTIGHSTRSIEDFIELLRAHQVDQLIDVRSVPRSRHNPQFNIDALPASLAAANIGYAHASGLGGFRRTTADSPNTGWHNLSFRGYADYMQTADFAANLASLIELAHTQRVALMCAEAVPWRCHRSLIADALVTHGIGTCEIASPTRLAPHKLTPFACVRGLTITYPHDGSPA